MKYIKLLAATFAIMLAFTACSSEEAAEKNGCFGDTEWGMTVDEVNNSVDYLLTETKTNITYSAETPEDIKLEFLENAGASLSELHFDFDKKKELSAVRIVAIPEEGSMDSIVKNIISHFNGIYTYDENNLQNNDVWKTDTGSVSLYAVDSKLFIDFFGEE